MKLEVEMSVEELLDKLGTVAWLGGTGSEEARRDLVMSTLQKNFSGNYTLEEYYNPDRMCFKYRLKFLTEQDEMWFKLKYG